MKAKNIKPPSTKLMVIAAVSAAAVMLSAYFVFSPTHRHYNPEKTYGAKKTYSESGFIPHYPPNIDAEDKVTKPYSQKEIEQLVKDRSDLAAQWAMAKYTFMGIWVGVIGIFFLVWTLHASRRAAFFAEEALSETKTSSERELRAYLSVHIMSENFLDSGRVPTIWIRFQNRGMSPTINISCHVIGMGANETISNISSIQPNDTEEIEWPLEDLNMRDKRAEEYFKIIVSYSDIFNGKRFIDAGFFVTPHSFPQTKSLIIASRNIDAGISENPNPRHITERKIQFRTYKDDLQQEAKDYAEANKAS